MPVIQRRRSVIPAILVAFVLALLTASPALADTERGHTGDVGFHGLRDKMSKPGVKCSYKRINPSPGGFSYEGRLKLIEVRPPKVRAISGTQKVGWRFVVQRQRYFFGGLTGAWKATYRSPIQKATTNTSQNAPFSWMSVNVGVPSSHTDDEPNYRYRVLVRMFWYQPDSTVQGKALHQVDFYRHILRRWPRWAGPAPNSTEENYCEAWQGWEIA